MVQSSLAHGDLTMRNWTTAVQTYRHALDVYRRVLAMRVQRETRLLETSIGPRPGRLARTGTPRGGLEPLTAREQEVAALMARGYTNQQIAEALVLTRGTVANHVGHILGKLGATNRTQVAAQVLQRIAGDRSTEALALAAD